MGLNPSARLTDPLNAIESVCQADRPSECRVCEASYPAAGFPGASLVLGRDWSLAKCLQLACSSAVDLQEHWLSHTLFSCWALGFDPLSTSDRAKICHRRAHTSSAFGLRWTGEGLARFCYLLSYKRHCKS